MIPPALAAEIAGKSDEELQTMVDNPGDWLPEAVSMAAAELAKRGLVPTPPPFPEIEAKAEPPSEPVDYRFHLRAGLIVGVILVLVGSAAQRMEPGIHLMMTIASRTCFIWACAAYAGGKGYSSWFGLSGILSCLGFLPILFLQDRRKEHDDHY